ncbi:hypothetical protein P280DRAFT_454890 [Massarina eburnea CBS 473.64]|uniref:Yeast cell wall synthesis Kre9/Knh1-like N-terminal domain-containing protein n=1 Tax=Massarina eburnea CBS 473.64 TaxID=1395130 RepID=A0A6A6RTY4_9PLEO|nr:hypothetical protein P280DRAFT_454890 [Massarina eburnea CBS 473.64]
MFTQVSAAALFAGLAAAYHAPVGDPTGNPITRPLNEIVPACKAFSIEWTPTTSNTVSLVLLKGPSTNVIPVNAIVEGIANSGQFTWTPDAGLEATTTATGYGLEIIDDVTGQYQYSTQFGIDTSGCVDSAYNTISSPVPSETKIPVPTASGPATTLLTSASASASASASSSSICTTSTAYAAGTATAPTKANTVPASLQASASATAGNNTVLFPGAASGLQAGMGVAGFVAALVAML